MQGQPDARAAITLTDGSALGQRAVRGRRRADRPTAAGSAGSISTSQPAPYGSVLISSGSSASVVVAGHHRAGDRRVDLRHALGRLDLAERLAGRDRRARLGQLHVDDVAERVLREVGDADPHRRRCRRRPPTRARRCTAGPQESRCVPFVACLSPRRSGDRAGVLQAGGPRAARSPRPRRARSTITLPPSLRDRRRPPRRECSAPSAWSAGSPMTVIVYGPVSRAPSTTMPAARRRRSTSTRRSAPTPPSAPAICIASAPAPRSSCTALSTSAP